MLRTALVRNLKNPVFNLARLFFLFGLVLGIGVVGYILIEHFTLLDAIYMTVITLSTVGFNEVNHLSDHGRMFTIFLIITNIGLFAYFIALITRYFLDGDFLKEYKLYKMMNKVNLLTDHVIVCGLGRNGIATCETLLLNKIPFVVIEQELERIENCPLEIGYYIISDATRDDTLIEAGIDKARALIVTLPEDADNLFTVLTARELNKNLLIVSRASKDSSVKKLKIAGADNVLMPDKLGGVHMATLVLSPDVKEFIDILSSRSSDEFMIKEIIAKRTFIMHKAECWEKTGATILGIKKQDNEYILNPQPEQEVLEGWRLIVMGSSLQLQNIEEHIAEMKS